jgi:hypothetical protein
MGEVIIVKAIQTCSACPSQWDAWDLDGNYWYLRYRHGQGTAERQPSPDPATWNSKPPNIAFEHGDLWDGCIELEEFCQRAGLNLALA